MATERRAAVALGVRVLGSVVALAAAIGIVAGHDWLGLRALWGLGLLGLGVVLLWRPGHGGGVVVAAVLVAAGAVIVGTPIQERGEYPDFDSRVLADDLAPLSVHVATVGLAISAVACGTVAAMGRRTGPAQRTRAGARGRAAAVAAGLVAGAVLAGASVPAGAGARSLVDQAADAGVVDRSVHGRVEQRADGPGPARPSGEPAWQVPISSGGQAVEAVPGWDVVLFTEIMWRAISLTAVSATEGEPLWTYERRGDSAVAGVDPQAGRILLVGGGAAVVLDLRDGSELTARRLPGLRACRPAYRSDHESTRLDVSRTASLDCRGSGGDRVAAVDVSTGRLIGSVGGSTDESGSCHDALATGSAPVLVRGGAWPPHRAARCGSPEVAVYQPSSQRFEWLGPVEPPPAWSDLRRRLPSFDARVVGSPVASDDLIVVALAWVVYDESDPGAAAEGRYERYERELVALDRDGEVRWRRSGWEEVSAVTDQGVLIREYDRVPGDLDLRAWTLISPEDGSVLTSDTRVEHESERGTAPAIDGERLYTLAYDAGDTASLVTRDLADLSDRHLHEVGAPNETLSLHAADGRLVLRTADGIVAYGDAEG
jgi:hypothetical protein